MFGGSTHRGRTARVLLVALALATAPACTRHTSSAPPAAPLEPMRVFTLGTTVPVTLFNDTARTACHVYLAPTAAGDWGRERLGRGADAPIPPGHERVLLVAKGGSWDVRVEDCGRVVIAQRRRIPLQAGLGVRLPVSRLVSARRFAGPVPLRIVNDTPDSIADVQISPSTEPDWGSDWLARDEIIPSGGERVFMVAPGAGWDIRLRDKGRSPVAEAHSLRVDRDTAFRVSSLARP